MMTQIKFKTKFKTQKREPDTRKIISLHVSTQLNEVIGKAAHKFDITKQDLIRQMVRHCLNDLGYTVPQDTDNAPPRKRKYKSGVSRMYCPLQPNPALGPPT